MVPAAATAEESTDTAQYVTVGQRRLAYATYGDPTGRPVLFCHGTPGSRLLGRLLDAPATERGIRVIAPDRPGIGDSDGAAVGIDDWPDDAAALLSHLDADRAGVLGFSGGAPYALACHRLAAVESVTLVSGAGPPGVGETGRAQRAMGALARHVPWLCSPLVRLQRWALARRDPDAALDLVAQRPPETEALSTDEVARLVKADVLAATARGPSAVVRELGLLAEPWPVDLRDVSVPVTVFQGRRDRNVAPETGAALARRLPEATLERVDSDHLGSLCVAAGRALRGPTPV
ncbi:alpha/beta fold hydrolase [Haloarcula onubensis]|uniref:Alpha/beta hydrolase n=1 Tax=Haloarcula onubensis TaxID=2950539 RepID=A0ABU2FM63_9EURY|nr:alpha/beta hydrolase [Halomicroarcula sp. S3CR25-11]MDS0281850.1 alpha/beta hydrolase [Halomicroarcula sp. S3CR25-11]